MAHHFELLNLPALFGSLVRYAYSLDKVRQRLLIRSSLFNEVLQLHLSSPSDGDPAGRKQSRRLVLGPYDPVRSISFTLTAEELPDEPPVTIRLGKDVIMERVVITWSSVSEGDNTLEIPRFVR